MRINEIYNRKIVEWTVKYISGKNVDECMDHQTKDFFGIYLAEE